jgi:hypothetical protein
LCYRGFLVDAQEERGKISSSDDCWRAGRVSHVVLGGAHHLGDNIRRLAGESYEYVRVRARTYDEHCRRYGLD